MAKAHRANSFTTQDQSHFVHQDYTIIMDPGVQFADLFAPSFWAHVSRGRLRQHDRVRCIGQDGVFDVTLTVMAVPAGGVMMRYLSGDPGADVSDARAASIAARKVGTQIQVVPLSSDGKPRVRTQFLPATKWRVIGIDGKEVVATGLASQIEAEEKMAAYLKEIHMRLPDPAEVEAAKAAEPKKDEGAA